MYMSQQIGHAHTLYYSCDISEIHILKNNNNKVKKVASVSQLFVVLACTELWLRSPHFINLKQDCLRPWEVKSKASAVQGHPRLHKTLSQERYRGEKEEVENFGRVRRQGGAAWEDVDS